MHAETTGATPDLPNKFRGVYWMSTNVAPELLVVMEGSRFDASRHSFRLRVGDPFNWSWSRNFLGFMEWFFVILGYLFLAELVFEFEDETYTKGTIRITVFHCIPMPQFGMTWTMENITPDTMLDGNLWDRGIYVAGKRSSFSYTLMRVIDSAGNEIQP